jgi:hypothetical protein
MHASNRTVFAALAVALAAGIWLNAGGDELSIRSPAKIRSASRIDGSATRIGTTGANASGLRSPVRGDARPSAARPFDSTALSASMIRYRFETSLDHRALYDELVRSGAVEGKFFAAKMLLECLDVAAKSLDRVVNEFIASMPPDVPFAATRIAAFRQIKEPCAGFSGQKHDPGEVERLFAGGATGGDPRATSWMLAQNKLDPATDTMAVAARLLDSGDPYALNNVANFLFRGNRLVMIVDGALVDGADLDAVQMAWDLVSCDHGWPCGRDSEPMLNVCARDGLCAAQTFEELVRTEFGILASFERVQYFRNRILAALGRRDYASLGVAPAKK